MAPPAGFDTEQIRDKARKDLLYLLSVVSKRPPQFPLKATPSSWISFIDPSRPAGLGPRQEEPRH